MKVLLEFVSAETGDCRTEGPFEFVQFTYNNVRVGREGEREIAYFTEHVDGMWKHEDGSLWSDLIVAPVAA